MQIGSHVNNCNQSEMIRIAAPVSKYYSQEFLHQRFAMLKICIGDLGKRVQCRNTAIVVSHLVDLSFLPENFYKNSLNPLKPLQKLNASYLDFQSIGSAIEDENVIASDVKLCLVDYPFSGDFRFWAWLASKNYLLINMNNQIDCNRAIKWDIDHKWNVVNMPQPTLFTGVEAVKIIKNHNISHFLRAQTYSIRLGDSENVHEALSVQFPDWITANASSEDREILCQKIIELCEYAYNLSNPQIPVLCSLDGIEKAGALAVCFDICRKIKDQKILKQAIESKPELLLENIENSIHFVQHQRGPLVVASFEEYELIIQVALIMLCEQGDSNKIAL